MLSISKRQCILRVLERGGNRATGEAQDAACFTLQNVASLYSVSTTARLHQCRDACSSASHPEFSETSATTANVPRELCYDACPSRPVTSRRSPLRWASPVPRHGSLYTTTPSLARQLRARGRAESSPQVILNTPLLSPPLSRQRAAAPRGMRAAVACCTAQS
ncbi:hypothetical protein DFH09DRAFT_1371526 [Mycena vulgaris]|nr:hypothetical protein DFH09DRAFT_1371526 [Mycena vulgaris]